MNEIELLKSLDKHDNIVCLLDYKVTPSVIFMVMEYGEIDLAQLIQKQTKKAWDINFIKYYWNQVNKKGKKLFAWQKEREKEKGTLLIDICL